MDWSQLSEKELDEFLSCCSSQKLAKIDKSLPETEQAQQLFEILQQQDFDQFPLFVVDLYLASKAPVEKIPIYTPNDIQNLTRVEIQKFAKALGILFDSEAQFITQERILRVLRYAGKISPISGPELFQTPILEHICRSLKISELTTLRKALGVEVLNCPFPVKDKDGIITFLPFVNNDVITISNYIVHYGSTYALMEAIIRNKIELVKFLLKNGVDVNSIDVLGRTALTTAYKQQNNKIIELLEQYSPNIDLPGVDRNNALLIAAARGNNPEVLKLIKKGANINAVNSNGNNALIEAVRANHEETVKLLLENGFDKLINQPNMLNETAIFFCSSVPIAKLLIDNGSNINRVDNSGRTPLLQAAQYGRNDLVKYLLERGADFTILNHNGESALMVAAKYGSLQTVQHLINAGANINERSRQNNKSALDLAEQYQHWTVAEFLRKSGATR